MCGGCKTPGAKRKLHPPVTCTFGDCKKALHARGFCDMHYLRWKGGKDLKPPPRLRNAPMARFWSKVNREGPMPTSETGLLTQCWQWVGCTNAGGYGEFSVGAVHVKAHRYSYTQLVRQPEPGMLIDHICHNRACVRPDHLREATRSQNTQNLEGAYRNSASGKRGVYWEKNRWRVIVRFNGKNYQGGRHDTLEQADAAAIDLRNRLFTHNTSDRVQ
jgi:hypothetical protein